MKYASVNGALIVCCMVVFGLGVFDAVAAKTPQYTETETETEERVVSATAEPASVVKLTAGPQWAPFTYFKNIEKGSALDFSGMPYFQGPAGRFGRVVVRNGHFEFENLPGVPQRFFGANLCSSANFLTHEMADEVAERFRRMGLNSVRIHHHDRFCMKDEVGPRTELDPEMMERLDYLVAALVKRGIYLETDLFVSRGPVTWRDLGIDRDGTTERYSQKALMTFHPPAYSNWCAYARAFLTHRNPYTGRTYAEEPAWVGIGLINEGRFVFPFPTLPKLKPFQDKWRAWIAARRKADPGCYPELGNNIKTYPKVEWKDQKAMTLPQACCDFTADLDREFFLRARKFLREDLGCHAPLSNNNNSEPYVAMQLVRDEIYDFVDVHNYFGGVGKGKPPISACNTNVFKAENSLSCRTPWMRICDKPVVVTEMNFPHPNPHRAGGMLTAGAIAAFQDYGAIWHFAYAHGEEKMKEGVFGHSRFDLALDPANAVGLKMPFAFFVRGDLKPARARCALVLDEASVHPAHGFGQYVLPRWGREAAWLMRGGCCSPGRVPADAKAFNLMDVVNLETMPYRPEPEKGVSFDGERGALTVVTPCSVAGTVPSGNLEAGPLRVAFGENFGTAFAVTLDSKPIAGTHRLLFSVLGDVQFDGATYADASRTALLDKGAAGKPIVRVMELPVALQVAGAEEFAVYALDTAGRRTGRLSTACAGTALTFTAATRGPDGKGVLCWEIVREGK